MCGRFCVLRLLCGVDGDVAGRESREDYCIWMGLSRMAEKVC